MLLIMNAKRVRVKRFLLLEDFSKRVLFEIQLLLPGLAKKGLLEHALSGAYSGSLSGK
jgi:hypothetical protein